MNILIVDDEPIIRIGLRTLINWENYGLTLAAEASNGLEALEYIQSKQVDILITDIRMPIMDGLELIRRTQEYTKNLKILVLSCLDDFSYVKEAMKLGVKDYILKPTMEPDELLSIILQQCEHLQEERDAYKQRSLWQAEAQQSRQFQLGARIRRFINEDEVEGSLVEDLFVKDRGLYSIMVFHTPRMELSEQSYDDLNSLVTLRWQDNAILMLFTAGSRLSELEQHNISYYKAQEISRRMHSETKTQVDWLICIGPSIRNQEDLKNRIHLHRCQLHQQFYALTKEHIVWQCAAEICDEAALPYEERNDLIRSIINNNTEGIFYQIEQISQSFINTRPELSKLHVFIMELLSLAAGYAREQGYTNLEQFEMTYVSLDKIQSYFHIKTLNLWLLNAMRELWGYRFGSGISTVSSNPFINKALKFMKMNYYRSIGTSDIADDVKLSRSYLSDLYSKEMNESLSETLAHIRIDEAKKKLRTSEKKIYEIAVEVGFSDPKTFAKTFKKIVGCTPKEYDLQNK